MCRSVRLRSFLAASVLALVGLPAVALADTGTSSNWAGYAAHKNGVTFRDVTASWRQPKAICTAGYPTYSAMWVGLGGNDLNANALEQIGTELDCSASGTVLSSAWYEFVPAPSAGIAMTVRPGDLMSGAVTVIGHRVTLSLTNRTRHKTFSKTVSESAIDVTSAEWIVEAPSECFNNNRCQTLPLADFGSAHFSGASAQTASRQTGSISSRLWGTTKITLVPGGRSYIAYGTAAQATPSPLQNSGTTFEVAYSQTTLNPGPPPFYSKNASAARAPSAIQPGGRRH
jgi:hypothetical protein